MNAAEQAFRFACRTHTGLVREMNEDAVLVVPRLKLMLLADGMGGHNGGDIASSMAVDCVSKLVVQNESLITDITALAGLLENAVTEANLIIHHTSLNDIDLFGMGTTFIAVALLNNRLVCVNVGDSRLYRFRNGQLTQLTRDHTVMQEQIDAGLVHPDAARLFGFRGLLTRAVGIDASVETDVITDDVERDDYLLLCSDGLTDMLIDEEIATVFSESDDVDKIADHLVELAITCGGRDNISVIVAGSTF